jgi:DsbC/DsbD-like thiol-disulfide interchange protein
VIRALGLLNARVQEDHAAYGIAPNPRHVDLPYPGVFVLDRDGVVTDKRFYESYRERETGRGLAAQALGIVTEPSAPVVATGEPGVTAQAWLDSPTYVFFQRLVLTVEVSIARGFHVYGQPAGEGLTPLSVEVDPIPGLEVGPARWPRPQRLEGPGSGARPWVHEGVVRGTVPLTFSAAPGGGDHVLGVSVHYQAGDGASPLVRSAVRLAVPVREAALVGRSLPSPTAKPS